MNNEENLLSFVHGLDFDKYTHDLELQTLMDQLRKRIRLLELEKKKDETKLKTCSDVSTRIFSIFGKYDMHTHVFYRNLLSE